MKFSLIIPVFNRESHLLNLLEGIRSCCTKPSEIVIVNMGDRVDVSDFDDLLIKTLPLAPGREVPLPLAKARNMGAAAAGNDILFFLDVDCIPSSTYFDTMLKQGDLCKGLIMATPKYLIKPVGRNFTQRQLMDISVAHPYRPVVKGCELNADPGLFWSLCFTVRKSLFNRMHGFDEGYVGYGAEDTDLAFTLREKGHNFFISDAVVFHQQHPVHSPPFHKFREIIDNSSYFFKKWGVWPMEQWLQAFENQGLIEWTPYAKKIKIRTPPTRELIDSACREKAAYM